MRIVSVIIKYENKNKRKIGIFMQRMSFERPTDHYDERLSSIDEKICALLKERKELSNGNPGFRLMRLLLIGQSSTDFIQTI